MTITAANLNPIHASGSVDVIHDDVGQSLAVVPESKPIPKPPVTANQLLHAVDFAVKRTLEQKLNGLSSADYFVAALAGAISVYDQAFSDKVFSVAKYASKAGAQ